MNKESWIKAKKQILFDHLFKKNNRNIKEVPQEIPTTNQNKTITKFTPWTELIDRAKGYNSEIIQSSLDLDVSGFRLSDKVFQSILDIAFERT
jgi:hypothetical protein